MRKSAGCSQLWYEFARHLPREMRVIAHVLRHSSSKLWLLGIAKLKIWNINLHLIIKLTPLGRNPLSWGWYLECCLKSGNIPSNSLNCSIRFKFLQTSEFVSEVMGAPASPVWYSHPSLCCTSQLPCSEASWVSSTRTVLSLCSETGPTALP